jgi:hypothetical protein
MELASCAAKSVTYNVSVLGALCRLSSREAARGATVSPLSRRNHGRC